MKIFKGAEEKKPAPAAPALAAAAAPAAAQAPAPAAPAPAPAAPTPDLTAIIDANVKEMSEKIARLATNIEGEKGERADFESKLEKMEERMRKLSALTEMISAQYNPFVGAAPSEREPMPQPEVGLTMPPAAIPLPPAAHPFPSAPPHAAAAATAQPIAAPPEPAPPMIVSLDDPFASVASALSTLPPEAPAAPSAPTQMAPLEFAPQPEAAFDPAPEAEPEGPARLWSIRPGFGSSMLMLSWADMLLKNAPTRESLVQLLDYYHNIGWIGDPARDAILAYADGIAHAASADATTAKDWRASLEVHEKSLLFVEKLRAIAEGRRGD